MCVTECGSIQLCNPLQCKKTSSSQRLASLDHFISMTEMICGLLMSIILSSWYAFFPPRTWRKHRAPTPPVAMLCRQHWHFQAQCQASRWISHSSSIAAGERGSHCFEAAWVRCYLSFWIAVCWQAQRFQTQWHVTLGVHFFEGCESKLFDKEWFSGT